MSDINIDLIRKWLRFVEDGKEFHYTKVLDGQVDRANYPHLRKIFYDLVQAREVKTSGKKDGIYRKIIKVEPVDWLSANEKEYFDLAYPYGHEDNTRFGFEHLVKITPGDLIVIAGTANIFKTGLVLCFLGENIDIHPCVLMGNEYTAMGNEPSPKFKRRMMNMKWVEWRNSDGTSKFDLLPVRSDFEDYIVKDKLNIVDWIALRGEFWEIGGIMEDMKNRVGKGIIIAVVQKGEEKATGRGGDFTKDFADLYITIDPFGEWQGRIAIEKAKDYTGRLIGRSWAFKIVDNGANLHDIREIVKCPQCWGRGYTKMGKCENCRGHKFIEKT